jgi:ubiquinone/menaquinone biosynthesis C-methylase UbiE
MTDTSSSPADVSLAKAIWFEQHRKDLILAGNFAEALETYHTQRDFILGDSSAKFWDTKYAQPAYEHQIEKWRIEQVFKHIDSKKTLLNVCAGRGKLEEVLAKKYPKLKYTGTDIARKMQQKLQKKFPQWKFQYAEVTQLPFPKNSFQQVLLLEILQRVRPRETFAVLAEVKRVLSANGQLIISVPINENLEKTLPVNPNSSVRLYSEPMFRFELEQAGFKIRKILKASAFAKGFGWKHRLNQILGIRRPNTLVAFCTSGVE